MVVVGLLQVVVSSPMVVTLVAMRVIIKESVPLDSNRPRWLKKDNKEVNLDLCYGKTKVGKPDLSILQHQTL